MSVPRVGAITVTGTYSGDFHYQWSSATVCVTVTAATKTTTAVHVSVARLRCTS